MPNQNIEGKLVYKQESKSKDGKTTYTRIGVKADGSETVFLTVFGDHVQTVAALELGSMVKLTKVNAKIQVWQGKEQLNLTLGRFGSILPQKTA